VQWRVLPRQLGRNNCASCALTDGYRGYRMPLPLTTGAGPCYRDVLRRVWGSPPTRCSLQTRAAGRSQISGRLFPHPRRMRRALSYCCRACITGAAPSQTRADGGSSLRPPPFLTQRKAVLQRNWQVYAGHRLREDRGAPRTRPKTLFEKRIFRIANDIGCCIFAHCPHRAKKKGHAGDEWRGQGSVGI
jgi:hypothetical protein